MITGCRLLFILFLVSLVPSSFVLAVPHSYTAQPGTYFHLNFTIHKADNENQYFTADTIGGVWTLQVDPEAHTFWVSGYFENVNWYGKQPFESPILSFQHSAPYGWVPFPAGPGQSTQNFFDPSNGALAAHTLIGSLHINGRSYPIRASSGFQGVYNNGLIEFGISGGGSDNYEGYYFQTEIAGSFRYDGPNVLKQCRDNVADLTADSDVDNIPDYLDKCLNSSGPVDNEGCSKAQFCAPFLNSSLCKKADWKNDQPLGASDCSWQSKPKQCVAKQ